LGAPVGVVYASTEDSLESVVWPRLMAAGADCSRVYKATIRLSEERTRSLVLPQDVAALEGKMKDTGARILILDPLLGYLTAATNIWREPDVRRALDPLTDMAEHLNAAIIAVMHLNKSQVEQVLLRIAHSMAFVAAARSVLLIAPHPTSTKDNARVLVHVKNNLGPKATARGFEIHGRSLQHNGETYFPAVVEWIGDAPHVNAATFETKRGPKPAATMDAMAFLITTLRSGPKPMAVVLAEAMKAGIAPRTLYEARKRCAVKAQKDAAAGETVWTLPE
jgi:hypothetical protein